MNTILYLVLSGLMIQTVSIFLKDEINNVNNIEIHYFKGDKTKTYKSKKRMDVIYLKDLILKAQNTPIPKYDTTGEIIYFTNKTKVFTAYFCTHVTGSKFRSTNVVIFQLNNQRIIAHLNYGSGMLIDEQYYQSQEKDSK